MTAAPLLLLVAGLVVQEPVQVEADLSRAEIAVGETAVLRVDVRTDGIRAEIGSITRLPPGLELAGSRDYDQRQFSIPGGTRRFITREFILRGRAEGRYRVPEVQVTVQGRTYRTSSQVLTVTAPPPGAGARGGEGGVPEGDVVLRAWLDADTAYVGEQVTMQAEAMFSQSARLRLRRAPEYEAPSPSGFWVHDLPDERTATTRMVEDRVYEIQSFRRAFFPLAPGREVVPPARLEYEMRRGILYAPETFETLSDSMPLIVLPVPTEGRPPEFTGAVGRYTVSGTVAPAELPAGEATVLTVEVRGLGNTKALPPPQLPEIEGVEVYPPSEEAETTVEGGRVGGTKRFSWILIPRQAGTIEIPPIRFPYFDPERERFETAEVAAMTLEVAPGDAGVASQAPARLRYLKTEPSGGDPLDWVSTPWFALAQLLPLLALAAGWTAARRTGGISRRELRRRRRAGIRALERRAPLDDPGLLADAESFARQWLADRTGLRPSQAGRRAALVDAGVPEGAAALAARALERIGAARYAPVPPGPEARRAIVQELAAALERVDRGSPGPPRPRPATAPQAGAGAAGVLACLLAATALAAAARPAEAGQTAAPAGGGAAAFATGIAHFDAGRFDAAAQSFEAHVRASPRDAAAWYNLGTAYYRAGHPGYAIWAWLRALRLVPRDRDITENLRVADVSPELVRRVTPVGPLRPEELALLASAAWFLAGGAGAFWLAGKGRGRGVVAAVALGSAVALGAAWLASTAGRDTLIVLETATLRGGPTLGGEPVAELEPGTGLVPVATYGEWRRVRTLPGTEGWIENRSVGAL